ncbi:MAG: branched-chain amino acid aminotransferase [Pseudomonadota bacterium]
MNIQILKTEKFKEKPKATDLTFGTYFTDHMFSMDYAPNQGWHNPGIEPYAPISMDPSTTVLHYGQTIFEGLKAYRTKKSSVQLFRPKDNLLRLNSSAKRLCIPEIDVDFALLALKKLLLLEHEWVPHLSGTSLYIRPAIIAMDPYLGVRPSHTYKFFIILCPVGAYYPEGFNPVKIWVTDKYVRTIRGGIGRAKTAGNYAASLYAAEEAKSKGYTQVLWLDGVNLKYIEEVGTMNIFFKINNHLVTPPLGDSILAGITRDSVLALARHWNITTSERRISIDEVVEAHNSGTLQEVFGAGTAAVISPVSHLSWNDRVLTIGDGGVGPLAHKLYNEITAIQYGKVKDPFGWIMSIDD